MGHGQFSELVCSVLSGMYCSYTWGPGASEELSMHYMLNACGRQTACHCSDGQSWGTFLVLLPGTQELRDR